MGVGVGVGGAGAGAGAGGERGRGGDDAWRGCGGYWEMLYFRGERGGGIGVGGWVWEGIVGHGVCVPLGFGSQEFLGWMRGILLAMG